MWLALGAVSVVGAVAADRLVGRGRRPPPPSPTGGDRAPLPPDVRRLVASYACAGFGYVITATYLVLIVRDADLGRSLEVVTWCVVGAFAIVSTWWTWSPGPSMATVAGDPTLLGGALLAGRRPRRRLGSVTGRARPRCATTGAGITPRAPRRAPGVPTDRTSTVRAARSSASSRCSVCVDDCSALAEAIAAEALHTCRSAVDRGRAPARSRQVVDASVTARANTASSIGSVNRPVNVFCWLGWNEHSSTGPPATATSTPWPKRGRGRTA